MYSKLQYISSGNTNTEQITAIQNALDAGCDWIQLRFKEKSESDVLALAEQVKKLCDEYSATLIINDFVNVARNIDANGVHLGLDDSSIAEARAILGNDKFIGGTANTLSDVLKRIDEQCNYVGLGPFRFTSTKANLSPVLGLNGYSQIIAELEKQNLTIPVYAIGGILPGDVEDILNTGVYGIAVSGVITNSADQKQTVEQFKNLIYVAS